MIHNVCKSITTNDGLCIGYHNVPYVTDDVTQYIQVYQDVLLFCCIKASRLFQERCFTKKVCAPAYMCTYGNACINIYMCSVHIKTLALPGYVYCIKEVIILVIDSYQFVIFLIATHVYTYNVHVIVDAGYDHYIITTST